MKKKLKMLYGSKKKARSAEAAIRNMNRWVRWANENRGWNESVYREVKYGIN